MVINGTMADALNLQIKAELDSAYLYLSMAAWLESSGWMGAAHWMKKQSDEEYEHAMRIFNYLISRGGKVQLEALDAPEKKWRDLQHVFKDSLEHERLVTSKINHLVDQALSTKEYATLEFLHWFIKEQVEEEESVSTILTQLEKTGSDASALMLLDQCLGKR